MADGDSTTSMASTGDAAARIAALESALAERDARIAELERERDELRAAYDRLWVEVELMRRRIFIAKAERVDTTQLELEFADKLAELDKLAGTLGIGKGADGQREAGGAGPKDGSRPRPKGRRDLRKLELVEDRVEITDPELETLALQGKAQRIDCEESYKLAYQRGGLRRPSSRASSTDCQTPSPSRPRRPRSSPRRCRPRCCRARSRPCR